MHPTSSAPQPPDPDRHPDPRIERTRSLVLGAAAELLGECGFDAITIEAIADRSGVARSTIYRHWEDRLQLLVEAVRSQGLAVEPPDTGTLRSDLVTALGVLAAALSDPRIGALIGSLLAEARRDAALAELHETVTRARLDQAVTVVDRAVARGELPRDVDARQFAHDIVAPLFFRAFITHDTLDEAFIVAHVDRWIAIYGGADA